MAEDQPSVVAHRARASSEAFPSGGSSPWFPIAEAAELPVAVPEAWIESPTTGRLDRANGSSRSSPWPWTVDGLVCRHQCESASPTASSWLQRDRGV